jgi:hypothetical protein
VLLTSFSTTLPFRIVVVVVSLTTVPSGWVVVIVLVVEVVELVVTGAGGITAGAVVSLVVVVEEQPTARAHAAAAIRTNAKWPKRKLMLKGCRGGRCDVNNEPAPEPLVSKHRDLGSRSELLASRRE